MTGHELKMFYAFGLTRNEGKGGPDVNPADLDDSKMAEFCESISEFLTPQGAMPNRAFLFLFSKLMEDQDDEVFNAFVSQATRFAQAYAQNAVVTSGEAPAPSPASGDAPSPASTAQPAASGWGKKWANVPPPQ